MRASHDFAKKSNVPGRLKVAACKSWLWVKTIHPWNIRVNTKTAGMFLSKKMVQ
jgi:hypothetical protein